MKIGYRNEVWGNLEDLLDDMGDRITDFVDICLWNSIFELIAVPCAELIDTDHILSTLKDRTFEEINH